MIEPAFQAASTPSGMATMTAMMMVATDSARVGSILCRIRSATGRLEKIEIPRSPCRTCQTQGAELDIDRLIEAELFPDPLDVFGARVVARDHRRGIAGRQMQKQENENAHPGHDRDRGKDASHDVGMHGGPSAAADRWSPGPSWGNHPGKLQDGRRGAPQRNLGRLGLASSPSRFPLFGPTACNRETVRLVSWKCRRQPLPG